MRYFYLFVLVLGGLLFAPLTQLTYAQPNIDLTQNEAFVDFPEAVDFRLRLTSDTPITAVSLQYGTQALACGDVTAIASPEIEPSTTVDLTWRWDVIESGIIPPGGVIWWQWILTTEDGEQITLDQQTVSFEDDWFVWRTYTADNITVHWYRGSQDFAQQMHASAVQSRAELAESTGLLLEDPINLYLYEETFDIRRSIPGAPNWAGGVAFPEHNIVLVATNDTSDAIFEYGQRTTKHEVGHLVIGRLTFNCLTHLPTWLSEGLAQVAEGEIDPWHNGLVTEAVDNGRLLTIRQLEGNFSIHRDRASLSYAQSDHLTRFLLDTYGADAMFALLNAFKSGMTQDQALQTAYNTDTIGIDNLWRESLGAELIEVGETAVQPTPIPTLGLATLSTDVPSPTPTIEPSPTSQPTQTPLPTEIAQVEPTTPPTSIPVDTPSQPEPASSSWMWLLLLLIPLGIGGVIWWQKQ